MDKIVTYSWSNLQPKNYAQLKTKPSFYVQLYENVNSCCAYVMGRRELITDLLGGGRKERYKRYISKHSPSWNSACLSFSFRSTKNHLPHLKFFNRNLPRENPKEILLTINRVPSGLSVVGDSSFLLDIWLFLFTSLPSPDNQFPVLLFPSLCHYQAPTALSMLFLATMSPNLLSPCINHQMPGVHSAGKTCCESTCYSSAAERITQKFTLQSVLLKTFQLGPPPLCVLLLYPTNPPAVMPWTGE